MGTSMTEIQESANRWAILAVLLFALENLLHALALMGGTSAASLERAAQIAGILWVLVFYTTLICLLLRQTILLRSLTGPADLKRRGRTREDGFSYYAIKLAATIAFVCTLMTLNVLDGFASDSSLPASFFLEISLFVLGATYSVAFFAISYWPERTVAENDSA